MKDVTDALIADERVNKAVAKAGEVFRREGCMLVLDRLTEVFYEAMQDAAESSPDLRELITTIGPTDTMTLALGWMHGHPAAMEYAPEDRKMEAGKALLLAAVAAGWSAETCSRVRRSGVN